MRCKECDCPILLHMKYYKHTDGTILCEDCFKKYVIEEDKE